MNRTWCTQKGEDTMSYISWFWDVFTLTGLLHFKALGLSNSALCSYSSDVKLSTSGNMAPMKLEYCPLGWDEWSWRPFWSDWGSFLLSFLVIKKQIEFSVSWSLQLTLCTPLHHQVSICSDLWPILVCSVTFAFSQTIALIIHFTCRWHLPPICTLKVVMKLLYKGDKAWLSSHFLLQLKSVILFPVANFEDTSNL